MNDQLIDFEERNFEDLARKFVEKHNAEWSDFVLAEFIDKEADKADAMFDIAKESRYEDQS